MFTFATHKYQVIISTKQVYVLREMSSIAIMYDNAIAKVYALTFQFLSNKFDCIKA